MDLFEYQARDLFEAHGVPVLKGAVATTPEAAFAAAQSMGGRVVVKAQVKLVVAVKPVVSSLLRTLKLRAKKQKQSLVWISKAIPSIK